MGTPLPLRMVISMQGEGAANVEGHALVMGGERLQITPDLVADVAAGGGAVGAEDDELDLPQLHQMARAIVHGQGMGHAMCVHLPGGEVGALIARAGFAHPDIIWAVAVPESPVGSQPALQWAIMLTVFPSFIAAIARISSRPRSRIAPLIATS